MRLVGDACIAAFFGAEKDKDRDRLKAAVRFEVDEWRAGRSDGEPVRARVEALLGAVIDTLSAAEAQGHRPVVVCSASLRPAVRRLVAPARPDLRVLAYPDLARSLHVEPVGVIRLESAVAH